MTSSGSQSPNRLLPGPVTIGHRPHGTCAFAWCDLPAEQRASFSVSDATAVVLYRFCPQHGSGVRGLGCHPTGIPQVWDFGPGRHYSNGEAA